MGSSVRLLSVQQYRNRHCVFVPSMVLYIVLLLSTNHNVNGDLLMGATQTTYAEGEQVNVKMNALRSIHTQIPKGRYCLPGCVPDGGPTEHIVTFGERLVRNQVVSSSYSFQVRKDVSCATLCSRKFTQKEADQLSWYIQHGYHYNFPLDIPPAAGMSVSYTGHVARRYAGGLPIGFRDSAWQQLYGGHVAAHEAFLDDNRDNKDNTEATVLPLTNTPAKTDSPTWTLLHADVFRPPSTMPTLFAVLVGTGAQLFVMVFCAIALAF